MTERQKDKVMLYMIIRSMLKNKNEDNIDMKALDYILKVKNGLNFEEADKMYKRACREYRRTHF